MGPHDQSAPEGRKEPKWWLDDSRNVDRLVRVFYVLCAILVAIDIFVPKHSGFALEHVFGFYGWFGFIACVALVLIAKQLRRMLMRREDYYDR
jgi:hypothetical protein